MKEISPKYNHSSKIRILVVIKVLLRQKNDQKNKNCYTTTQEMQLI